MVKETNMKIIIRKLQELGDRLDTIEKELGIEEKSVTKKGKTKGDPVADVKW